MYATRTSIALQKTLQREFDFHTSFVDMLIFFLDRMLTRNGYNFSVFIYLPIPLGVICSIFHKLLFFSFVRNLSTIVIIMSASHFNAALLHLYLSGHSVKRSMFLVHFKCAQISCDWNCFQRLRDRSRRCPQPGRGQSGQVRRAPR